MKRFISLLLALVALFGLCSCGSSGSDKDKTKDTDKESSSDVKNDENKDNDKAGNLLDKEDEGLGDKGLKAVLAFAYDYDVNIVVKNTCDQAVLNFNVAYVCFDRNGLPTTAGDEYEKGSASAANIMPGDKSLHSWYDSGESFYVVATVCGIDYQDGTTWEAEENSIKKWAKNTKKNFKIENYQADMNSLKAEAALAETNEYLELTSFSIEHGNQFSDKHDLHFTIKNISEKDITIARIFVLEYDDGGFPVSVSPYDTYCLNGHTTGGNVNLRPGESSSFTDDLFLSGPTENVKVIVSEVEFHDGTVWNNPYLYEWVVANNHSFS